MALTGKQKLFVAAYVETLNATKAAIRAGYSKETAAVIGCENLRKPNIRAAIDDILDAAALGKKELLARLSDHAVGTMDDFVSIEGDEEACLAYTNLGKAKELGQVHLIKEFQEKVVEHLDGSKTRTFKVKLYDAQSAIKTLMRAHGMLELKQTDDDEPNEIDADEETIGPDDLRVEAELAEAAGSPSPGA